MQLSTEQDLRCPSGIDAGQSVQEFHSPTQTRQTLPLCPTGAIPMTPSTKTRVDDLDNISPNTEATADLTERTMPSSPFDTYHSSRSSIAIRSPASAPPTMNRKVSRHPALQAPPLTSPSGGSVRERWSYTGGDIPPLFREISAANCGIKASARRRMVHKLEYPVIPDPNQARRFGEPAVDYYSTKYKKPSKLNAVWPPNRSTPDSMRLSLMRSLGVVPPLVVKSRRTSFEPRPAHVMNLQAALKEIRASCPEIAGAAQMHPSDFVRNRNRKKPQRRTSLRVRWGGPTLYLIDRIHERLSELGVEFDPELLSEDRFLAALGADAHPKRPVRSSSFRGGDDDWYDSDGEDEVESSEEDFPCHNRPDVWVTPFCNEEGVRSWRVKRKWNIPQFDEKETEHTVEDTVVMDLVKSLFGVAANGKEKPEIVDGKWIFHKGVGAITDSHVDTKWVQEEAPEGHEHDSTSDNDDVDEKPWKATWIFDEGGQIVEDYTLQEWLNEPEMHKQFQKLMDDEQNQFDLDSSITSFEPIPEEGVADKHKERAFARPDGWVSPVDGNRKVIPNRSWKLKAIDITKDSAHSDITEESIQSLGETCVPLPAPPNACRKPARASWKKVELQDSHHSINSSSTDTTEQGETTAFEADPMSSMAEEDIDEELPTTIPRFGAAAEFPPDNRRKALANLLDDPSPWKLVLFEEPREGELFSGYVSGTPVKICSP